MGHGKAQGDVFDPARWGLPPEAVADLGHRLWRVWCRFRDCFRTKTRDTSVHALVHLRGLLTMESKRNFANIARRVIDPDDDGQHLQHFMSDSPWSAQAVFDRIQAEIRARVALQVGLGPGVSARPGTAGATAARGATGPLHGQRAGIAQGRVAFAPVVARGIYSPGGQTSGQPLPFHKKSLEGPTSSLQLDLKSNNVKIISVSIIL